jgi:hypothetical protein
LFPLGGKYTMRIVNVLISLLPTPLFTLGFIWELTHMPNMCGNSWSMPAMWAIMALAHLPSWFVWWDQRALARYRRPVKQQ